MDNPIYCPMSFANDYAFDNGAMECTPNCAWAVNNGRSYACAVVIDAVEQGYIADSRSLKDDTELQTTPNYSKDDNVE